MMMVSAEKRQVAKDMLSNNNDFEIVIFIMPNGDIYFDEPYSRQQISTTTNLAFRDYFKGAIRTSDIYLGDPTPSASSGQMRSVTAVPVYSLKDNSTVVGLWAGGIDFDILNKELQSLVNIAPSSEGADNNGNEICALITFERGDSIRSRFTFELVPASIKFTDSIMPLKKKIQRLSIQFLV